MTAPTAAAVRPPGRLARALHRVPLPLFRLGLGRVFGHTFLLLSHEGRRTGRRRETVAMAMSWDAGSHEAVVFSAWGRNANWFRNIEAHPALAIEIGGESYVPEQRFLSEDEGVAVVVEFRRRHPWRTRIACALLGWGDLGSEAAVREFVRSRPFVAFRPRRATS